MLKIKDLNFTYKKSKDSCSVFENLNLIFSKGFNVILGPNGAGKSTLLKAVFGLLEYEGEIFYANDCITTMSTDNKVKLLSYLPQMDIDVSTLTVLEMVILGRLPELGHKVSDEDLDIVMETLESLHIAPLASRSFGELSGGQKKLVFIAQTLVRNPKLVLLDEPVNSLDLQKQLELCQLLQRIILQKDIDIIVVLHDINLAARYAQHIVVIDENGKVYCSGRPQDIITPQMVQDVYGVICEMNYDQSGIPTVSAIRSVRTV